MPVVTLVVEGSFFWSYSDELLFLQSVSILSIHRKMIFFTAEKICPEGFYKCYRGPCINETMKCNENLDCAKTWDDEDNCSMYSVLLI